MKKCEASEGDLRIDGYGYRIESLAEYRAIRKLAGMSGVEIMPSAREKADSWQERGMIGRSQTTESGGAK